MINFKSDTAGDAGIKAGGELRRGARNMQATERSAGGELRYPRPSIFVGAEGQTFILLGLAVPILFMLLNALKIYLLSPHLADSIIVFFGHVSPVLEPQYNAIKRLRTIEDASNYSAFVLILIMVAIVFLGRAVYRFTIERNSIGRTRWIDVGVTILCLFVAVPLQFLALP